jgi:hypothetical protein
VKTLDQIKLAGSHPQGEHLIAKVPAGVGDDRLPAAERFLKSKEGNT